MKGLVDYINESAGNKIVRFVLKDLKVSEDFYSSLENLHNKTGIYYEKTDDGFKLKIKPGEEGKLEGFIDLLNFVVEDNKKADDADSKAVAIESLENKVAKLYDIANSDDESEKKDDEPEKKEEE